MSNQLLQPVINYINRVTPSGITKLEITNQLLGTGWTHDDINNAFATIVNPTSSSVITIEQPSKLASLNKWLINLIIIRLVLLPVQYFFIPLLFVSNRGFDNLFSTFYYLNLTGLLLPLLWFFPLFSIRKNERSGYVLAIFFSIVLIFLNFSGLFYLNYGFGLGIFSLIYVLTGIAIIIFASRALGLLPKQKEFSNVELPISKSGVITFAAMLSFLFAVILLLLTFFGGESDPLFGSNYGHSKDFIPGILAIILSIILGWRTAFALAKNVQTGRQSSAIGNGVFYGAFMGAVAQLPLYGFSGIQIFAMPIGAMIGAVVGFIASIISYFIMRKVLIKGQDAA